MNQRDRIQKIVAAFPPLPEEFRQVIACFQCENPAAEDLVKGVETDPIWVSRILLLANHPYFSRGVESKSLSDVAHSFGVKGLIQLWAIPAILGWFQKISRGYTTPCNRLWEHCITVGIGVEKLAEVLKVQSPDYGFLCGFLHDIGKVVLEKMVDVSSLDIIQQAEMEHISVDQAERRRLGIDHMEIGALVLQPWSLPYPINEVLRHHHQPELFTGDSFLLDLVHSADAVALMMGIGPCSEGLNYRISPMVENRMHLKVGLIEQAIVKIQNEIDSLFALLIPWSGERYKILAAVSSVE